TVFEYFETMERFTESGQFDRGPGTAFVPEADTATYNGSVWLLTRRTFWTDPGVPPDPMSPEYLRAVQFYQQHAVGPAFVWSWRSKPLEQGVFRETIRRSDDAFRTAQNVVGALAAEMGAATESLAARCGPATGGLLNATCGNAAELIVAIVALRAGLVDLVKASLTGSILGNLLLILGLVLVASGRRQAIVTFNRAAAGTAGAMLLLAV